MKMHGALYYEHYAWSIILQYIMHGLLVSIIETVKVKKEVLQK